MMDRNGRAKESEACVCAIAALAIAAATDPIGVNQLLTKKDIATLTEDFSMALNNMYLAEKHCSIGIMSGIRHKMFDAHEASLDKDIEKLASSLIGAGQELHKILLESSERYLLLHEEE